MSRFKGRGYGARKLYPYLSITMLNDLIRTLSFLQPRADDDFVDRVNYYYTTTLLIIMALLVSFKMFGGRPVECWLPAEYTQSWEQYAEMYCWAQSTYWVPFDQEIPNDVAEREYRYVSYYQWVPFFLLIVALFFYLPCLFWRLFNDKSDRLRFFAFYGHNFIQLSLNFIGVRMQKIIAIARNVENIHPETRHKNIQALALHLDSVFRHQFKLSSEHSALHRYFKCLNLRYYEAYLSSLYIIIKTAYLINVVGQLFLMNRFLQTDDYNIYGIGVLTDLLNGRPWETSGNFPRVTLCDLLVRRLGNVHRYTVQCVLVINIFTEKIFILLWLWYSILSVITLINLLYWAVISFVPQDRIRFVSRHLELADRVIPGFDKDDQIKEFTLEFIKMDGIFVLRMLNLHAGLIFTSDLVDALWELFDKTDDVPESAAEDVDVLETVEELEELSSVSTVGRDHSVPNRTARTPAGSKEKKALHRMHSVLIPLMVPKGRKARLSTSPRTMSQRKPRRRFFKDF